MNWWTAEESLIPTNASLCNIPMDLFDNLQLFLTRVLPISNVVSVSWNTLSDCKWSFTMFVWPEIDFYCVVSFFFFFCCCSFSGKESRVAFYSSAYFTPGFFFNDTICQWTDSRGGKKARDTLLQSNFRGIFPAYTIITSFVLIADPLAGFLKVSLDTLANGMSNEADHSFHCHSVF